MPDGMSFDKYIDNPSGGASVVTNRAMYKEMYSKKFDKVLLREQGKIDFKVYNSGDNNDSYYIYFKIPSEVIDKFYYDVVIRLYTTQNSKKSSNVLRQYAVGFYSNDPAFVYTFAYSFRKNRLFITDLDSVMSRKALNNRASTRNPNNQVWYVKSLYFAYLAMEKYDLFNRIKLDKVAQHYDKKALCKQIMPAEKKVQLRQEAEEKLRKEQKVSNNKAKAHERAVERSEAISNRKSPMRAMTTKTTKASKTTKVTRRSTTSKKT